MKTRTLKILMLLTVLAGSLASCKDKNEDVIISPIVSNEEVNAFFETYLPLSSVFTDEFNCFFADTAQYANEIFVINNEDEFKQNFACSDSLLPTIDFEAYTLIIGRYIGCGSSCFVEKHNILDQSNELVLNITMNCEAPSYSAIITTYHWGIYPKLPNKPININVTTKI